jgi:hypothetical protein
VSLFQNKNELIASLIYEAWKTKLRSIMEFGRVQILSDAYLSFSHIIAAFIRQKRASFFMTISLQRPMILTNTILRRSRNSRWGMGEQCWGIITGFYAGLRIQFHLRCALKLYAGKQKEAEQVLKMQRGQSFGAIGTWKMKLVLIWIREDI